jgi:hypothetical protein
VHPFRSDQLCYERRTPSRHGRNEEPQMPPMNESNAPTRRRWCPRCGARTRVIANPFYGVGLAVHQYLTSCKFCGFVEFLPTSGHDREETQPMEPADMGARSPRGRRWARTNRVSLTFLVVFVVLSIAMLAVVLLR